MPVWLKLSMRMICVDTQLALSDILPYAGHLFLQSPISIFHPQSLPMLRFFHRYGTIIPFTDLQHNTCILFNLTLHPPNPLNPTNKNIFAPYPPSQLKFSRTIKFILHYRSLHARHLRPSAPRPNGTYNHVALLQWDAGTSRCDCKRILVAA
jgi:hypothetical protein